uniref:Uncharacterized protein n=1 Tax=Oryza barthii TaxID=65489 RepID=A0A0D3GNS7_9ORYZ
MAHPSPSLLFLSQIRFSPSVVVLPVLTGVGLSIEAESELLVVASSATMTLNKRPGNEARGWRWSILREPQVKTLPSENPVPFGMSIDSILDVVPLLEALLRRPRVMLSKLLAFGKLGNDDFCEVSIVAFFSFYV